MRSRSTLAFAAAWSTAAGSVFAAAGDAVVAPATRPTDPGSLEIRVDQPGPNTGDHFYGLMTEEINHAYDGGLYAELIQNRIFRDDRITPAHWSPVGPAKLALDAADPINETALTTSLHINLGDAGPGNRAGVSNDGFYGIPVWPNTTYHASFYARGGHGFTGPLLLGIESADGKTVYASGKVDFITAGWGSYEATLTTGAVPKTPDARFVISAQRKGSLWLNLVSLFPPTYHDRPNGNRVDLMEKLAALHPTFLRFPGGNGLEGGHVADRFDWRTTVGPLEQRPGHWGPWGYRTSDGLGLLEFLEWCEDLHMQPLLAVYAGLSLAQDVVKPGPDLQPFVQEDLDEIEYCTGDPSTKAGRQRATDGHPAPFDLQYVEIGNEDHFDNSGSYDGRFAQIFDAIKKAYPQLKCIATTKVTSRVPDLYDDHDYPSVKGMLRGAHRYDDFDAKKPRVFFGEWATQDGAPTPTLRAALADAAWLTGLQHDPQTVLMNCYAPLLVNVNPGASQWPTNLIGYNGVDSFGSPSYWCQVMFAENWGDAVLPVKITPQEVPPEPAPQPHGAIGLATWRTSAAFADVTVTRGGQTLFQPDFSKRLSGWSATGGTWDADGNAMRQKQADSWSCRVRAGDPRWTDYTVHARARKLAGAEGFILIFHAHDADHYLSLNLGGAGNTQANFEEVSGTGRDAVGPRVPFTVRTGVWYDLRVQCHGTDLQAFVDGKLLLHAQDVPAKVTEPVFAVASRAGEEVILKVVNTAGVPQVLQVSLAGVNAVEADAPLWVLRGEPGAMNSLSDPTRVVPRQEQVHDVGLSFVHPFPADSVSVLRVKIRS